MVIDDSAAFTSMADYSDLPSRGRYGAAASAARSAAVTIELQSVPSGDQRGRDGNSKAGVGGSGKKNGGEKGGRGSKGLPTGIDNPVYEPVRIAEDSNLLDSVT